MASNQALIIADILCESIHRKHGWIYLLKTRAVESKQKTAIPNAAEEERRESAHRKS